jgi:uncharacterized protein YqeY
MKTKIEEDLKQAMRDKDSTKLNVLRGLKSAFTNASLQKGNVDAELSDIEIVNIIRKQFSQRQDSIKQFVDGQRFDLVAKEEVEMEILKEYLPTELSDGDLEGIVWLAVQEYETPTKKDMGAIIKKVMEVVNGRADNKRISKLVMEKLS